MNEQLKQDHLAKKHNKEGFFDKDCILCVNRKNGKVAEAPIDLGIDVKEEVKNKDALV